MKTIVDSRGCAAGSGTTLIGFELVLPACTGLSDFTHLCLPRGADLAETADRVSESILRALNHTSVEINHLVSRERMQHRHVPFWIHSKEIRKLHHQRSQTLLTRRCLSSKAGFNPNRSADR